MNVHWGWRLAIVYTLFAVGTLSFVGFALTNEVDLVRSDYYEQGLRHDADAAASARAAMLTPAPLVERDEQQRSLRITLPPSMVGARLSIELYCPSRLHQDKTLELVIGEDGTAVVPLRGYTAAPWVMTASWTHTGKTYRISHGFTVRS